MLNKDKLEYCNVLAWHEAGYTGKGVKIAHLEGSFNTELPFFDGMIRDPFNRHQDKVQNLHQVATADILHQVAPGAEIYALPSGYPAKPGLIGSMEFCIEHKIPLATMSLGGSIIKDKTAKEIAAYEAGTFLCKSAGNEGSRGLNPATKQEHWWSVGACTLNTRGQLVRTSYSSVGEELDVMSFGNVYVHDARDPQRAIYQTGTSFACPFFVGLMALYYQWHVETYGRYPTIAEAKEFVLDNCMDLGEPGRDDLHGHGLFVLPDPAALPAPRPREEVKPMPKQPKVYVSPSTQGANMYAGGLGTEKQHMQDIGGLVEQHLVRCGFEVRCNKPEMTLTQAVSDSNAWGPEAHVAIHSNAGGGQGTECWHYTGSTKGQALALAVYNEVAQLTPASDRGVKYTLDLYEVAKTSAPACILEVAFHDRAEEAAWIVAHKAELAEAIAKGVCKYFGVVWVPGPQPAPPKPDPAPSPPAKTVLKLTVGGREIRRSDGKVFPLDVPAKVEAGRTLVPLRAIAEALGCFVHYDPVAKEITITWEV